MLLMSLNYLKSWKPAPGVSEPLASQVVPTARPRACPHWLLARRPLQEQKSNKERKEWKSKSTSAKKQVSFCRVKQISLFREEVNRKKTFSFGHCPNHLNPPPHDPNSGILVLFFQKSKFKILKRHRKLMSFQAKLQVIGGFQPSWTWVLHCIL